MRGKGSFRLMLDWILNWWFRVLRSWYSRQFLFKRINWAEFHIFHEMILKCSRIQICVINIDLSLFDLFDKIIIFRSWRWWKYRRHYLVLFSFVLLDLCNLVDILLYKILILKWILSLNLWLLSCSIFRSWITLWSASIASLRTENQTR